MCVSRLSEANFVAMREVAARRNAKVVVCPSTSRETVDVDAFRALLRSFDDDDDRSVRIVCMTHVPTNCGAV